jgi:hypothetical protein
VRIGRSENETVMEMGTAMTVVMVVMMVVMMGGMMVGAGLALIRRRRHRSDDE